MKSFPPPLVEQTQKGVAYFGGFLHGLVLLFVVVNGAWHNRRFSLPLIGIVALLASRICVYFSSYANPKNYDIEPSGLVNVSLLCFLIVVSAWHVLVAARIQRSKRFVLTLLIACISLTNAMIDISDADGCSFFAPFAFVLVVVCLVLVARAVRGGSSAFGISVKKVPVELVAFHILALILLLAATIRSDKCTGKASEKTTGAMIIAADTIALVPVMLASWLKMDELLEHDDYDEIEDESSL